MNQMETAVRLSPIQRQLCWMLLPIATGIIASFYLAATGPHQSGILTWTIAAVALTPGHVKTIRHQVRTRDGFWLSQSISVVGTIVTTAASYIGLWIGAAIVIGLLELYTNPAAQSGTMALCGVVPLMVSLVYVVWRKAGRRG
jgi:hypothetical protein